MPDPVPGEQDAPALPALPAAVIVPAGPNPAAVYLASLAEGPGRASMRSTLAKVADALGFAVDNCPWHELRYRHLQALRSRWQTEFAPATVNKYISAVRGVLKQAWKLGTIGSDDYRRAASVENVRGSRLPRGRSLGSGEINALFRACGDGTPAGARDAAAFSLMFGCGLRRAEAVSVRLEHCRADSGEIRIVGKGNRERAVYATNGTSDTLTAWIGIRGGHAGPLLCPVTKGGIVKAESPMTAQAVMVRLKRRAAQAGIADCTPHDLRRSFVSTALENGADLAMVQALAGHANPETTARYDRRPEEARRRAAESVQVPFVVPF